MTTQQDTTQHDKKVRLYELFAEIGKALSSSSRLELLDILSQAPHTVDELAAKTHLSLANASQHLQRLKAAGLVSSEREGTFIRYHLADPAVARLWLELRAVGERQLPEVERALDAYRPHRRHFKTVSAEELDEMLRRDEALLVDVRPHEEYDAGHLPGAISMPLDEFPQRAQELPRGRTIVTYCRGPYCVYADQALELLGDHGVEGARLEAGVNEWSQAGRTIERMSNG